MNGYRRDIDGLRAAAAPDIVSCQAFLTSATSGFVGVDHRPWRACVQLRRGSTRSMAAQPTTRAVLPSADLCLAMVCRSAMDGRLIYVDDSHLSASGARRFVPGWIDQAPGR